MPDGSSSQQEEQDPIGFVSAALKSCTREPTVSDLKRIADLTKSSCVDNSLQWALD